MGALSYVPGEWVAPVNVSLGVDGKWTWGENSMAFELHAAKGRGHEEEDSGSGGMERSGSGRAFRIGRGCIRMSVVGVSPRNLQCNFITEELRHEAQ
jgi:hypothetical protein